MNNTKQTFPAVTIEALPNGLFRLEDESALDGIASIDLHPAQVQVLASMVGFTMPDKTRAALARLLRRMVTLSKQAHDLSMMLGSALDNGEHVGLELNSAEFIDTNLNELLQDLEAIQAPDIEPMADAHAHHGEQLTLPV